MARKSLLQRLQIDRRVLWFAGLAALMALGELSLRAWEAQQRLEGELKKTRGQVVVLAAGSDQIDWAARTQAAEAERAVLKARLWQSVTEAQAQARLRDWLTSALRSAEVAHGAVTLLPLQRATAASAASGETPPALRVRATLGFDVAPNALERTLVQIEASDQLARIDSLVASARNRRVEMTVSVPVLLHPEAQR